MIVNLKRYFSKITGDHKEFLLVLQKHLQEDNWLDIEALLEKLKPLKLKMSKVVYRECLEATKRYVNSVDFNRYGRYEKVYLLGKMIYYVRPTHAFKKFNLKLDTYIQNCSKGLKKRNKKRARLSNLFKFGFVTVSKVSLFFTMLLVFPMRIKGDMRNQRMCPIQHDPFSLKNNPFTTFDCSKYSMLETLREEIDRDFIVFGNAPLECAEFVNFPEAHHSRLYKSLQKKHVPFLSKEGDYLLLEGKPSLEEVPCDVRDYRNQLLELPEYLKCLGWDQRKPINTVQQRMASMSERYNVPFAKAIMLNPKENVKLLSRLQKFSNLGHRISLLDKSEVQTLENALKRNEDFYPRIDGTFGFRLTIALMHAYKIPDPEIYQIYYKLFSAKLVQDMENDIEEILAAISEATTISRNREMIKTQTFLKCTPKDIPCHRKLSFGGVLHFFDFPEAPFSINEVTGEETLDFTPPTGRDLDTLLFEYMGQWSDNSVHAEYREFLENERYVFLHPRLKTTPKRP